MTQIQFKKPGTLRLNNEQIKSHKADCLKNKNRHLFEKLRLRKRLLPLQPPAKKVSSLSVHNLRQSWFCTDCFKIFHLKPVKKYKTLQLFNLRCPHCYSGRVNHNTELTKAIAKQKPLDELLRICKEHGLEIEYEIKHNTKYFPFIMNAKIAKADKEYFFLNDDI